MSVVEAEKEVRFAGAEALQQVAVASREIPGVAGTEFVDGGLAVGHHDRGADAAFNHVRPFGGEGVPVELANGSGFEAHGDAGDALGDGKFGDGCFVGGAGFAFPVGLGFDVEFKARDGGGLFLCVGVLRR